MIIGEDVNMLTMYFIRHGESVGNSENRFRGQHDYDLTVNGIRQAEALGNELSKIEFDCIYSSPLDRAKKTAQIIARDAAEVISMEELTNVSLGGWENQPKENIRKTHPDLWKLWVTEPEKLDFIGMETFATVQKRAFECIMQLIPKHQNGTIAIVTHRAVLKPLFAKMLDITGRYFWKIDLDTASYSIAEYRAEKGFTFTCINQNKHLKHYIREDLG
jgi:broad specificity phosphatase PhoE